DLFVQPQLIDGDRRAALAETERQMQRSADRRAKRNKKEVSRGSKDREMEGQVRIDADRGIQALVGHPRELSRDRRARSGIPARRRQLAGTRLETFADVIELVE